MADTTGATGTDAAAPNHLGTNIESGGFDSEKIAHEDAPPAAAPEKKATVEDEEEEDEDMDALIDELESQDGHEEDEEEEQHSPATGRIVPEDMLQTDTRIGLTENEVLQRRKKYGLNQMKEEKENLILKFLGYFVGPIQFVMEVSSRRFSNFFHWSHRAHALDARLHCGIFFPSPDMFWEKNRRLTRKI
jgi:H+-transporting ATPase